MNENFKFLFNLIKKIKEKFNSLTTQNKIILIFLNILLILILYFTLNTYTNVINSIKNIKFINTLIGLLYKMSKIPSILIFIIIICIGSIIYILKYGKKIYMPLEILEIDKYRKPNISSNVYDITLANPSTEQITLKTFRVKWKYYKGMQCSIGQGVPIKPVEEYILNIPIDPGNTNIQKKDYKMRPMIVIPPGNDYYSITQIKVQFHYHFISKLKYHPCTDWNIYFSLDIIDKDDRILNIFTNYHWRDDEEMKACRNGTLNELAEKLEKKELEHQKMDLKRDNYLKNNKNK